MLHSHCDTMLLGQREHTKGKIRPSNTNTLVAQGVPVMTGLTHHVQGNTSIQVHPWGKRQFKFIQLNNPVQNGGK